MSTRFVKAPPLFRVLGSAANVESDWDGLVAAVVHRANLRTAEWGIVVDGSESYAVPP